MMLSVEAAIQSVLIIVDERSVREEHKSKKSVGCKTDRKEQEDHRFDQSREKRVSNRVGLRRKCCDFREGMVRLVNGRIELAYVEGAVRDILRSIESQYPENALLQETPNAGGIYRWCVPVPGGICIAKQTKSDDRSKRPGFQRERELFKNDLSAFGASECVRICALHQGADNNGENNEGKGYLYDVEQTGGMREYPDGLVVKV